MLRVGGRLKNSDLDIVEKHPIILHRDSYIATLIVRHYHTNIHHQGRHLTEGAVRSAGYWIVGCKRLISKLIHLCVSCKRLRGKLSTQKMADLPTDRLEPAPPFTFVGVDAFGPWEVVTRRTRGGSANSKRWAILFTCLTVRAIHIEIVEEMSSSAFINALRRFTSVRGHVRIFRSDNGTNFVGATNDLNISAINVEDSKIADYLHDTGSLWIFNPPHASHFGGVFERMIGVTRRILDGILLEHKHKQLTHDILCTFMAEVCAIVNSRPITTVSTDPDDPSVLSPAVLLTQKSTNIETSFSYLDSKDMYKAQWKFVQVLAERFWSKWRRQYLTTLQTRPKWNVTNPNISVGNVVLMKDNECGRMHWPLGKVIETYPSDDGLVRKAKIRIYRDGKLSDFIRPIVELVVLLDDE